MLRYLKDPENAHRIASYGLKVFGLPPLRQIATSLTTVQSRNLERTVFGVTFPNHVGLAAGFDKTAKLVGGLSALGFGFIEVGTVTQHAQLGNPRPRIFRNDAERSIINRMGFNNEGADAMKIVLERTKKTVPIGVSISKSRITELKDAASDYLYSFQTLYDLGDYFVINVSSPNTPGLRTLQDKSALIEIVSALNEFRNVQLVRRPLLVKIAPDLTDQVLSEVVAVVTDHTLDGIIATNTLATPDGGMSGRPLKERSTKVIKFIHAEAATLPIIGVGGIFTVEDAYEKLEAGASLVQIYSGLIYGGPLSVRHLNHSLSERLN